MRQKKLLPIESAMEMLNALAAVDPTIDPLLSRDVQEAAYNLEKFDLETEEMPIAELAKDCLDSVLVYLRERTKGESHFTLSQETVEEIKSLMLLVGNAASKLEAYFNHIGAKPGQVLNLPEYRELQELYQQIDRPVITQEKIGRWVLGIGKLPFPDFTGRIFKPRNGGGVINPQHVFMDMDAVRSDSDYELFFIHKEGGGRFFNPRLIRNMHLINEFGFDGSVEAPAALSLEAWTDTVAHDHALTLIRKGGSTFDMFTMERGKFKEKDLQNDLTKAMLALLLASQGRFLHPDHPTKSCSDFFQDFVDFFRVAVRSYDYQKLISYPPREKNKLGKLLLTLIHQLGRILFFEMPGLMACKSVLNQLVEEGYGKAPLLKERELTLNLAETVKKDGEALREALKGYGNSALKRTLEDIEKRVDGGFDPYYQKNWPHRYMDLIVDNEEVHFIRLPCPTMQRSMSETYVIEEFKAALRGLQARNSHAKILILNFQNRSGWKENKRCLTLEDLGEKEEWSDRVSVVTLEVDTPFYWQSSPYDEETSWEAFHDLLREHLVENNSTLFLPDSLESQWKEKKVEEVISEVHKVFFNGSQHLSREERQAFIDLTYNFLILKCIDILSPSVVAYTCKDGIELSNLYFGELYASLLLFNDASIGQNERDTLNTILFAPALFFRERAPDQDRIERVIHTLEVIEKVRAKKGSGVFRDTIQTRIGRLYDHPVVESPWFL